MIRAYGIALLVYAVSTLTFAQENQKELLNEASYIFNRFDEEAPQIGSIIASHYPDIIRSRQQEALAKIHRNVGIAQSLLNSIQDREEVRPSDIVAIYSELDEVTFLLGDTSTNIMNYSNEGQYAISLTKLQVQAYQLGTKVLTLLEDKVLSLQIAAAACSSSKPLKK